MTNNISLAKLLTEKPEAGLAQRVAMITNSELRRAGYKVKTAGTSSRSIILRIIDEDDKMVSVTIG